jgi:Zn-dependent alcohol dehydrogenase
MKQPISSFIPIRAAVLREPGTPLKIESLEMEGPREYELLIRIVASGVCRGLIRLFQSGRLSFDRLVRFYDFAEINRAIDDSKRGQTIKPALLIGQQTADASPSPNLFSGLGVRE